jgi:hypothetical protein
MLEREADRGDVLEKALLRDQRGDQQDLDRRAQEAAAREPRYQRARRRRPADEHGDGNDAAHLPRGFAAALAVELAVEIRNRAPGEHGRMRDAPIRRLAENRIEREAGDQHQERVVREGPDHRREDL